MPGWLKYCVQGIAVVCSAGGEGACSAALLDSAPGRVLLLVFISVLDDGQESAACGGLSAPIGFGCRGGWAWSPK